MIDKNLNIFNNRHPELKEKDEIWQLIFDSYIGGIEFKNNNYLVKYPKESSGSFDKRRNRSVYFNQLSPIVDMLSGFLFMNEPVRNLPTNYIYLLDTIAGKNNKFNDFMRIVSAYSFMFTCGVLVDMPSFDPNIIKTKRDVVSNNISPYAILYLPFKIRDFNVSFVDGELDWVILDNTYYSHQDPFEKGKEIISYRLWTRNTFQDFILTEKKEVQVMEENYHGLGFVPFRLHSWRDDNNDFVGESICEDIAMISKLIYNSMSYMDEMLASGTFKMLTYPSKDGGIPESMKTGGVGALSVIPYDINSSKTPSFIGAELTDIDPFLKAIQFYMAEILKKVGLSTDETKEFVKSGAAKRIDFQKMRALLISGSAKMGKLEEWILRTSAKWLKKEIDVKIEYNSAFSDEDLQTEVTMLTELLVHPIPSLRKEVLSLIVKKLLGSNLSSDKLQEIYKEIESSGLNNRNNVDNDVKI